jgi:hypothetical protein
MSDTKDLKTPQCCENETAMALYRLYRDYIQHEDNLINNRVGWFIQLHSFLIASYGIVFASGLATFFSDHTPLVPSIGLQALAAALLIGIAVIGLESSAAARRSIKAAHAAIQALEARWEVQFKRLGGGEILPHVIGGGATVRQIDAVGEAGASVALVENTKDQELVEDGAAFHLRLPRALKRLWIVSFVVPAAFGVLAVFGPSWLAGKGDAVVAKPAPVDNVQTFGNAT